MEKTLVIIKPGALQRELVGDIINRFERKGLRLTGLKMIQLNDAILAEHYSHLTDKPFFPRIKESMMASPVIVCCWEGLDCVQVVRTMTGVTNSRNATPGTIRGDFGMSMQENIIHTSDSVENGIIELKRFFKSEELFNYTKVGHSFLYATDEK
ncbi:MAG: nucleoside-diphosphate kinase [Paludibacteraceae bacterium]|nr:nucleoside-diphosphate kinase [Paludibacteraceae bacterium]